MADRFQPCDECQHFTPWKYASQSMPEDYNPCDQEHRLAFRMPDSPTDTQWGLYRKRCEDREPVISEEEKPPSPHESQSDANQRLLAMRWAEETRSRLTHKEPNQ